MEDGLTPAQQDAQAPPTDAKHTVDAAALEQVAKTAQKSDARPRRARDNDVAPHKMLYIGNLYYEVTAEQLKNVFSRFGEVASVKIVYDNRGLSRGYVTYLRLLGINAYWLAGSVMLSSRTSMMPRQLSTTWICRSSRAAIL